MNDIQDFLNRIVNGDCLEVMKQMPENSIDLICTDPPYGIGFMGKEWDTFKPDVLASGVSRSKRKQAHLRVAAAEKDPKFGRLDGASRAMEAARYDHTPQGARKFREFFHGISVEMLRVLKPGAFAFVCIGARQDSVSAVITAMTEAGFKTDFTSLFWAYASGFPKAANIGKAVDKRLGFKRDRTENPNAIAFKYEGANKGQYSDEAISDEAKTLQGSYGGFQPKPAVEVIVVAMKPLSEKTFMDQALKNGKGITWLDDCRIGTEGARFNGRSVDSEIYGKYGTSKPAEVYNKGRFPANLLVLDEVLKDHSRFFSLDKWAEEMLPFLIVPKASKGEKNGGLDEFQEKTVSDGPAIAADNAFQRGKTDRKNTHPTVKPLKLMQYLITLASRPGDVVLDPFSGSGTTAVAAKSLKRNYIGIDMEKDYCDIAEARIEAHRVESVTPAFL